MTTSRQRGAINIVVHQRIFQRGQIFTWTRERKVRLVEEFGLKAIINFWPKIDPDLADMGLNWSWQLSTPRSEGMLEPHIQQAAVAVADYLQDAQDNNVLILCEAGKTRSVFFCILVVAILQDLSYANAKTFVLKQIPATALKGFMLDWMEKQDGKRKPRR